MGPPKTKPDRQRRAGELQQRDDVDGAAGADKLPDAVGAGDVAGDSRRLESVAPAGAGVPVDVDRPAILEEAAAIAAASSSSSSGNPAPSSGAELAAAPVVDVQAKAADVVPAARMLVAQLSGAFAPNWEVTKAETEGVADSLALVLAYWMPDGAIDPKYVAVLSLAGALYGVAAQRREPDGSWKPLRKPLERAPAPSSPTSPAPAGAPAPLRIV